MPNFVSSFTLFLMALGSSNASLTSCHSEDPGLFEYFCPSQRYCDWKSLPVDTKDQLTSNLGYKKREWNYKTKNVFEGIRFTTLNPAQQQSFSDIGFSLEQHDCCNVHYKGYDWSEFPVEGAIIKTLRLLGYNKGRWNRGKVSSYDGQTWDALPSNVQDSLVSLCHTKETWDAIALPWSSDVMLPGQKSKNPVAPLVVTADPTKAVTGSPTKSPVENPTKSPVNNPTKSPVSNPTESPTAAPTVSPTVSPTFTPTDKPTDSPTAQPTEVPTASPTHTTTPSAVPSQAPSVFVADPAYNDLSSMKPDIKMDDTWVYYCPAVRYAAWNNIGIAIKVPLAFNIGYSQYTWDYMIPNNPVDSTYWGGLSPVARQNMKGLGYDEDKHDCCNNHYWEYDWNDINSEGYEDALWAVESLGFNETGWNEGHDVTYFDYDWEEIPENVTDALFWGMCYTKETWNESPWLPMWPYNATIPLSYDPSLYV